MKSKIFLLCILLSIATIVLAIDPQPASDSNRQSEIADEPSTKLDHLDPKIRTLLETQAKQLAKLQADFKNAASRTEAWEIQRQIRQVKIDTEIGIMEIQHRRLVAEGRTEEARSVETTLHALRNPDEVRASLANPEERPVPPVR